MDRLLEGYRRFRAGRWPRMADLYAELAEGQSPRTLVIACSDSRVDPAAIFDAAPGELFVIRNVANLVPPFEEGGGYHGTSAAIEFAVQALQVEEIVVLGHARCGGCAAALAPGSVAQGSFLAKWISLLEPAKARIAHVREGLAPALEHESIKVALENLQTFPFVAAAVAAGALHLRGARFDIVSGRLEIFDPAINDFALLP
ncbi:MAG: carbonic anhydrase [Hyphomonadaceae bacterium]|nr:carbonic anhydrase [Hyphomonadaceae bacterium]